MYRTRRNGALYLHGTFFKFPHVEVLLQNQSCAIPGSLTFCRAIMHRIQTNSSSTIYGEKTYYTLAVKYSQDVWRIGHGVWHRWNTAGKHSWNYTTLQQFWSAQAAYSSTRCTEQTNTAIARWRFNGGGKKRPMPLLSFRPTTWPILHQG